VLQRIQDFLPKLAKANESLGKDINIEDVDDTKEHIEMVFLIILIVRI
jgi:hypothetical protein